MSNLAINTSSSVKIMCCQVCSSKDLENILSLGHLSQVNVMQDIGSDLEADTFFPAELLLCNNCSLVQLSHIVDPKIIFPPSYSYTSRTTRILRSNFKDLCEKCSKLLNLNKDSLVVDIGSNDGTLLSNFRQFRALGVEPTDIAKYANSQGINTIQSFFNKSVAAEIVKNEGNASLVTAANVFAHIEDVHSIVDGIKELIGSNGVFVNESHYLVSLIETNQYDTVYHEHLRYYSLTSLKYLLSMHDLEIFDVELIPTHGGSIRVYSANKGKFKISNSVAKMLDDEKQYLTRNTFSLFKNRVVNSKTNFYAGIDKMCGKIGAIGSPSRASTLVNYIGLNEDIIEFVLEVPGSNKINKYMPGTKIPVFEETIDLLNSVDHLLLLSWHIADEIIPKLKEKGYKGDFILPLPFPKVIR
jgi:hypothetical protein